MINKDYSVSVVIPVYNNDKYIGQAIRSVLDQTVKADEIIVIDDGSTDNSAQAIKIFEQDIRYYYMENSGAGAARNMGAEKSTSTYLAFLDADDIWEPGKLAVQLNEIKNNSYDIVFGMVIHFYSPDTDEAFRQRYKCPEEPMAAQYPSAMLLSKESFYKAGCFDPKYRAGEFIEWYHRAKQLDLISYTVPDVLVKRRIHYNNSGIINKNSQSDYFKLVREMIKKRTTT